MFLHEDPQTADDPATDLQFLWKAPERCLYIMDNHRAALWCWLQEIRPDDEYSLLHVDWHWDSAKPDKCVYDKLEGASLSEFLAIVETTDPITDDLPAIRWDNFIVPMLKMRRKFRRGIFVGHQDRGDWISNPLKKHRKCEVFPFQVFWEQLDFRELCGRPIFDLDLDYFFFDIENKPTLAYSQAFISRALRWLEKNLPRDTVVTIALSPNCCRDLSGCLKVLSLACSAFGVQPPNLDRFYPGYSVEDAGACVCDCSDDDDLMAVPDSAWLPVVDHRDEDDG